MVTSASVGRSTGIDTCVLGTESETETRGGAAAAAALAPLGEFALAVWAEIGAPAAAGEPIPPPETLEGLWMEPGVARLPESVRLGPVCIGGLAMLGPFNEGRGMEVLFTGVPLPFTGADGWKLRCAAGTGAAAVNPESGILASDVRRVSMISFIDRALSLSGSSGLGTALLRSCLRAAMAASIVSWLDTLLFLSILLNSFSMVSTFASTSELRARGGS